MKRHDGIPGNDVVLIDTGMGYASIKDVIRRITRLPVRVLLTHTHWDHIGGAWEFQKIHVYDDAVEKNRLKNGFDSTKIPELQNMDMFEYPFLPKKYAVPEVVAKTVLDKECVVCDPWQLTVWHTPGHTKGSVCYYESTKGLLFSGDTVYPGPLYAFEHESNVSQYASSMRYLLKHIDIVTSVFPGHNATQCSADLIKDAGNVFTLIQNDPRSYAKKENGVRIYEGSRVSVITSDKKL